MKNTIDGINRDEIIIDKKKEIKKIDNNYYNNNKEKILVGMKKESICFCGSSYQSNYKAKHERTKKHNEYINNSMVNIIKTLKDDIELIKNMIGELVNEKNSH